MTMNIPDRNHQRRPGRPRAEGAESPVGNRTLVRGVELLKTLARTGGPMSLSEIARTVEMTPTSSLRYLRGLVETGLLHHDPLTGLYDLGPSVIELGLQAIGRIDAVRLATDLMMRLTEETGVVSILCVWGSEGPTVIRWEQGRLTSAVCVREGINLSILNTAAGRIFLAYMDSEEIAPQLEREMAIRNRNAPPSERITASHVARMREEIRSHGIARAVGEQNPALAALSAPVFDGDGRLLMSITIINAKGSFDTNFNGEPARKLKVMARELSGRLGWAGNREAV